MSAKTVTVILSMLGIALCGAYIICILADTLPPYPANLIMSALFLTLILLTHSWKRNALTNG